MAQSVRETPGEVVPITKSMYEEPTIVADIRASRIRWIGHVEKMDEERTTKKITRTKPECRRDRGRPRLRWIDDVEDDLRQLGVRGWRRKAQDRTEWRSIVMKARILNGL